jgi:hypothetical protein
VARTRAARVTRRTGIEVLPIVVYVVVAGLVFAGIFAADYAYRRRQEAANRPAPPEVIARNLVENIIGKDTVKASTFDSASGRASITFESATFKPQQPKKQSREFLEAEAELASQAVLGQMQQVKQVHLTIVYNGQTLATATAPASAKDRRGVQVTYVDPRVK